MGYRDSFELREFVDFLRSCEVAMVYNFQLPFFSQFVKFLTRGAKIACNPVTSLQALKIGEVENPKFQKRQSLK